MHCIDVMHSVFPVVLVVVEAQLARKPDMLCYRKRRLNWEDVATSILSAALALYRHHNHEHKQLKLKSREYLDTCVIYDIRNTK
eukprot:g76934.t1